MPAEIFQEARSNAPTNYVKSKRGRKPKSLETSDCKADLPWHAAPWAANSKNRAAGQLAAAHDGFLFHNGHRHGTFLDMLALAHGAQGCSAHALTERLNPAGFTQGIDSFTTLDLCTDLKLEDLECNGNAKLARAMDEALELFPLARGLSVLNEYAVVQIGTDINGIVKAKTKATERLIVASSLGWGHSVPIMLQSASRFQNQAQTNPLNVALAECGPPGHVWIIDKLLRDIGLNPIHADTSSSRTDLAQVGQCKLIVGAHSFRPENPQTFRAGSLPHTLGQLFDTRVFWGCFANPEETDISLRAIASHFDEDVQNRTEAVIAANRKKTTAVIAHYRPRLAGKLFLNFWGLKDDPRFKCFELLGMRVGNRESWPGKTGVERKPRISWVYKDEHRLMTYLSQAKPDLAYNYELEPTDWTKRGVGAIPFSPLRDRGFLFSCAYDGFAVLAATLDRHANAPWRKLVKPPWAHESG